MIITFELIDHNREFADELTLRQAIEYIKAQDEWDGIEVYLDEYVSASEFYLGAYYFLMEWYEGEMYGVMSSMGVRLGPMALIEREKEEGSYVYETYEFLSTCMERSERLW